MPAMSFTPGSRIGPYEVTAQLGEGGMGVVLRGRDSRLQRDVALKVLPEGFANDPERLSRFQREAQVLASLNHPNIAQIYGLEDAGGSTCIVMELVEGETLAERLKRGPCSFDEAIDIAKQIANALAAAHERGVVHRDLKPANIKLTPHGEVKVLDFGLAKAIAQNKSDVALSMMPTMVSGSMVGAIVGTPGYMSPEQARGKEVDARTDIWAFGCVLYEMLTARQAFEGETITDVVAKIVTAPPDLNQLPKDTPSSLRLLLSCALNKNSAQRLQHIGDSRLFLDGALVTGDAATSATAAPASTSRLSTIAAAVAVVALIAAAFFAVPYFRNSAPAMPKMRFEISLPGMVGQPVLSPDGRSVAYAIQPADGRRVLLVRPIGGETGQEITGTENLNGIIWSGDSRRMIIQADGKLKKVDLATGTSQILGDMGAVRGGSWNRDGVILLAPVRDNVIVKIADSGGDLTPVTKLDTNRKETVHAIPVFMPDGKRFWYVSGGGTSQGIYVASLSGDEPPQLVIPLPNLRFNMMQYMDGYLLYLNDGQLRAQKVDASNGKPQGDPIVIADELDGGFSVSDTGLLLFHKAAPAANKQLLWYGRDGKQLGQVGAVANYVNVDIAPKGDRAAVDITTDNNRDIWVVDFARSIAQPITRNPGDDWTASWSPDGSKLAFASTRAENNRATRIYEKSSTGAGAETMLETGGVTAIPVHWTSDNKYLVFSRLKVQGATNLYDTWILPLFGDRQPTPLIENSFDKFQARVSPDNRYIAYSTNESGVYQVVVQTFPDPNGGKWQISSDGGIEPKWRHDSRELYYLAFDGKLMSVSISGADFTASRPAPLFQTPLTVNRTQPARDRRYDVAPDGRFLMIVPLATGPAAPYTAIVNWTEGLER
jgi:Tol biopolymer transport system component